MAEITVASRRPSSHRVRPAALLSASGGSTLAERLRTHANDPLEVAAQVRLVAEAARPGDRSSGSPLSISRRARSIRREIRYRCGDMPNSRVNDRTR